ncbi:MAG: STAS domain-containing protein [Candidatus Rokuibacteriota bacterium]|jgi:rsbT co-antagonist protein RsbR|nr:STAS domain-containing protein [Patescibacteria group bacterium]
MSPAGKNLLVEIFERHEKDLLNAWMDLQLRSATSRRDLIKDNELREQSAQFLRLLRDATARAGTESLDNAAWAPVRELLASLSSSRARLGFTPSETATFVLSLKEPVFARLTQELGSDARALADEIWKATTLVDALGLYTTESYQKTREQIIGEQQREMLELSTPVVQLWDGVLGLPLIGTLDSARTQVVMENLLQRIVDTGARIAVIDITGVPTVDTLVAQHLLKTVAAARLMGADCIISGIRPQIAQTIVHLGLELNTVATKATLADAFALALQRVGLCVTRVAPRG